VGGEGKVDREDGPAPGVLAGDDLAAYAVSPEAQRSAALVICDRATDVTDARLLLEACGLASYERGKWRRS